MWTLAKVREAQQKGQMLGETGGKIAPGKVWEWRLWRVPRRIKTEIQQGHWVPSERTVPSPAPLLHLLPQLLLVLLLLLLLLLTESVNTARVSFMWSCNPLASWAQNSQNNLNCSNSTSLSWVVSHRTGFYQSQEAETEFLEEIKKEELASYLFILGHQIMRKYIFFTT